MTPLARNCRAGIAVVFAVAALALPAPGVPPADAGPAPSPAGVVGSTWYTDGSFAKSGPSGRRISAFATEARTGVGLQLVMATSGDPNQPCAVVVSIVNPTVRFAASDGFVPPTAGLVTAPPGDYAICFRDSTGSTRTNPVFFTII